MKSLVFALFLAAMSLTAQASSDPLAWFYLDSRSPDNHASFSLAAGDYEVGYTSDAWNPWSYTTCTVPLAGCGDGSTGWVNVFRIDFDGSWHIEGTGPHYMNPSDALAAGQSIEPILFTLTTPQTVTFKILDSVYTDNSGGLGLSLGVVSVPEPSSFALLSAGLTLAMALGLLRCREHT